MALDGAPARTVIFYRAARSETGAGRRSDRLSHRNGGSSGRRGSAADDLRDASGWRFCACVQRRNPSRAGVWRAEWRAPARLSPLRMSHRCRARLATLQLRRNWHRRSNACANPLVILRTTNRCPSDVVDLRWCWTRMIFDRYAVMSCRYRWTTGRY